MGVGRGPVGGASSNDFTAPIIQNITPVDGSEQQDHTTPITFDVFDYGDNIYRASITVTVNGELVLSGDTFYLGWTGSVAKTDFGYHVHLNPNFTGRGRKSVHVDAHVKDDTGLITCAEWTYITYVIPNTLKVIGLSGPLDGGTVVTIFGSGVSNKKYFVDFKSGLTSSWLGSDTGASTSGVTLPTMQGVLPSIESNYGSNVFDVHVNYNTTLRPSRNFVGLSTICELRAKVSSSTYCSIAHVNDSTGPKSKAVVYVNGTKVMEIVRPALSPGMLQIRRNKGHVEMLMGGLHIAEFNGWVDAPSNFVISSYTSNVGFTTTLTSWDPRVVVLFDDKIGDACVEYTGGVVRVHSPRYQIPKSVSMQMFSFDASRSMPDGFEYIEPPRLTVSNNDASVRIENDKALRDVSSELKGLRI